MKPTISTDKYELYLGDCLDVLPHLDPVDLLLTDPPYGIGEAAGKNKSRGKMAVSKDYGNDVWDDKPISQQLIDLCREKAKWNVIFGGNYYDLPPTKCWFVWDKLNGDSDFADCELAWTNLPMAVRLIKYRWNGMLRQNNEPRGDHPTQKPVGVMCWALNKIPQPNMTVLDPFMGSGTTGVACIKNNRYFIGIEKDEKYFEIAAKRLEQCAAQGMLELVA